ncbi:MAG: histidine kinase N-terminal 7TM domain-containing protein [Clostridia bacterium]
MYPTLLFLAFLINLALFVYLFSMQNKSIITKLFLLLETFLLYITACYAAEFIVDTSNIFKIKPVVFECAAYIGIYPLAFLLFVISLALNADGKEETFNVKKYLILAVPSVLGIVLFLTNDMHNLMFEHFSTYVPNIQYGHLFMPFTTYHYILAIIAIFKLLFNSVQKNNVFSTQSALIAGALIIALVPNLLATTKLINLYVYLTPVTLTSFAIVLSLCASKYKYEHLSPSTLNTVINTMTDGFVIISLDGTILTNNLAFKQSISLLNIPENELEENNFFNIVRHLNDESQQNILTTLNAVHKNSESHFSNLIINKGKKKKYYQLEIYPILSSNKKNHIGNLMLFKDITEHKLNQETLAEKQEIILTQSRLATIGELAGGLAHDINTPISTIRTGIQLLKENFKDDPYKQELLEQMNSCASKISDISNTVRNQFRNLGNDYKSTFSINKIINEISVICKNELTKYKCTLSLSMPEEIEYEGNATKLSQVITNLIVNAIQVYADTNGGNVNVFLHQTEKSVIIEVEDFAGGIDEEVLPHLFKNILTTKGSNGTGLGLYLSYSVIKSDFSGMLSVKTKKNVGTTFKITLPKQKII